MEKAVGKEGRGQRAEGRGQRAEGRGQRAIGGARSVIGLIVVKNTEPEPTNLITQELNNQQLKIWNATPKTLNLKL
jgi:hypothetical protein